MTTTGKDSFQPIHNPYIVGNPIQEQKMFFGREDDFTFIQQKVTGGKKGGLLVLCGSRRSGKTSILFQIMNGRLGDDFLPVLIDMQAMTVENDLDFLIKLSRGIIEAVGNPEISLEKDFLSRTGANSLEAFQNLIAKVNHKLHGKKLILLFDEYEIFESLIAKKLISTEILNLFASWIEHKQGVFIVFTGSDKLEERKAEYWSNFLGKALYRRISFLTRSDTMRLVEEPPADTIRYEAGVTDRIYQLTAGQPFYTQVICQALIDHLNEAQRYNVTDEDLQIVADQIVENPLPQMIFAWNLLTNMEKLALSAIGELNRDAVTPVGAKNILDFARDEKIGFRIDPNALNETLERLFYHDILDKKGGKESYVFKMDVWRRWMVRMHSIWQVIDEIKSGGEPGEGITPLDGKRWKKAALAGAAIAGAAFLVYMFSPGASPPPLPVVVADSTLFSIATDPPDAVIHLGNQRLGRTPLIDERVPAGSSVLRIELAGFKPVEFRTGLRKDEPFDTTITLAERTGDLKVTSSPSGASISLDGVETGFYTPRTFAGLSVSASHEIILAMQGFDRMVRTVRVHEDSLVTRHYSFKKSVAGVQVVTEPVGASVYIDGELRAGVTPEVYSLQYGRHRLVLEKDGYTAQERTIVVPMKGNKIVVELQELPPGQLIIISSPLAEIYINGEMKSAESWRHELSLAQGEYTITLRHHTFGTVTRTVRVVANEKHELTVDMSAEGVVQQ